MIASVPPDIAVTAAPTKKGGAPVSVRPDFQDVAMLNVVDPGDRGKPEQIIVDGPRRVSASQMAMILRECSYERQRRISADHVSVLTDIMKRGAWVERGGIDFARLDGRLILVNGHHRGHAQVKSGRTLDWTICIHDCRSVGEVESLYYAFDTNVRKRTAEQILHGSGFAEEQGISAIMAKAVFSAVPFIAAKFSTSKSDQDFHTNRIMDRRLSVAASFTPQARAYEACVAGASGVVRRKLFNGGLAAVALVTLKHQPEKATVFWSGVAQNDGLRRGDPRHTLVSDLLTRGMNNGLAHAVYASPALAWNAFYEGRQIKIVKVIDVPRVRIFGTPYGKA